MRLFFLLFFFIISVPIAHGATLDQSQTSSFSGSDAMPGATGYTKYAQQITAGIDGDIDYIVFKLQKEGSPVCDLFVELASDSADVPNVVIATSANVASSTIGTQQDVTFQFTGSAPTVSSTKYWLVLNHDCPTSGTDFFLVYRATANSTYTGGFTKRYNPNTSSWGNTNGDMYFQEFMEDPAPTPTPTPTTAPTPTPTPTPSVNSFGFVRDDFTKGTFMSFFYGLFFGFFIGLMRYLLIGVFERREA